MTLRIVTAPAVVAVIALMSPELASPAEPESRAIARTADQRPDLSGYYDVATLTPLQRPKAYGSNLSMTSAEADAIVEKERRRVEQRRQRSDPNRGAPPAGGGAPFGIEVSRAEIDGGGNVGGYNYFWMDRGTDVVTIDGKVRTSILIDPQDGRLPEMTAAGQARAEQRRAEQRPNDGTAWWLDQPGTAPYDDPESLSVSDRCLLGFDSTAGPPMLPVNYNNLKRIVQTRDHVVILIEMVHDARIVRIDGEHGPPEMRRWLGDSVGHWEGDTLVVDTTNFTSRPGLTNASENLHVVEWFQRLPDGDLLYRFTVADPTIWTRSWTGEYRWPATDEKVFEYACHEGNYAMGNILRGARLLEAEALKARASAPNRAPPR